VTLTLLACGGGSCNFFKPKDSPPEPKKPAQKEPPAPSVRLRDYLFPQRACTTTLRRSTDQSLETYDYTLGRTAAGREEITLVHRFLVGKAKHTTTETFVVDEGGIQSGNKTYAAEAHELDLLTPKQRLVAIDDTVAAPGGQIGPCVTALSRLDEDRIFRSYVTWCRGMGIARTDESRGKVRTYTEFVSTTCR
jgi:hypothetical protein